MKEQAVYQAVEQQENGFQARRSLTWVREKPYAEGTPIYMYDTDVAEIEGQSQSGTETQSETERKKLKAESSKTRLDLLVIEVGNRLTKAEKTALTVKKLESDYTLLSNAITDTKEALPRKLRKGALQPATKLQRRLRNVLLLQRSQERFEQKAKAAEAKGIKVEIKNIADESFLNKWRRRFTGEEWGNKEIREAAERQTKRGELPHDKDDEEVKAKEEEAKKRVPEVTKNSTLTDEDRLKKAEQILNEYYEEEGLDKHIHITPEDELGKAILKAHEEGFGKPGLNGEPTSVFNFTPEQIRKKAEILSGKNEKGDELFSKEERRLLMEAGIVGNSPIGSGPGGENESTPEEEEQQINSPEQTHPDVPGRLNDLIRAYSQQQGRMPTPDEIQALRGMADIGFQFPVPPPPPRPESTSRETGRQSGRRLNLDDLESEDSFQAAIDPSLANSEEDPLGISDEVKPGNREVGYGNERRITSAEVLAEEVMRYEGPNKWGLKGEFPLLKAVMENGVPKTYKKMERVEENGEMKFKEVEKILYKLDEGNFLRWVRERMMYWHSESPDDEYDFQQTVELKREFSPVNLKSMINNASRYFRSEATNEVYTELVEQIKRESWLFAASRSTDIQYRAVMGSDEDLPKAVTKLFYGNTFTKSVWGGKSGLYWMMTLPEHFKEDKTGDNNLGRALNLAYQTYYNLSDRGALEKLLGKDAPLLNATRIRETLEVLRLEDGIPDDQKNTYVNAEELAKIDNEDDLIKYINIFNSLGKPNRIVRAVRRLIQESIAEKFDLYLPERDEAGNIKTDANGNVVKKLDTTSVTYADTFALSMARWTGAAARNDVTATGYDAWTRVQITDEYRKKQLKGERGGAFGNPYTVNVLKQLGADLFNGIQVQNTEDGKKFPKSVLEVLNEMENAGTEKEYTDTASQLAFNENTMRGFAQDHLGRAFTIYQQVIGSEEINFDKFTHYDYIRGVTFDRQAFEEALKEKFHKPMRYAYSTYQQIDFGKVIRTDVGDGVFEERRLGEAMFGREIFEGAVWTDKNGKEHHLVKHGMEDIPIDAKNWSEKINWDAVSTREGKVAIWRQVALARLAAQLYAHKDRHSTDPTYNWWYYNEILESIESIPNDVEGNEFDMQSSKAVGHFYSHHNMEWLRKKSDTTAWALYRKALISDLWSGSTKGFKDALKKFFEGMTKSK